MSEPTLREIVAALAPRIDEPEIAAYLQTVEQQLLENPLLDFEPHAAGPDGRRPQLDFIEATTDVVAAFAGNQFGKTTTLTICSLREALPRDMLPSLLARTKRFDGPTRGWIIVPTVAKIEDSFRDAFERWCPPSEFKGGNWGKAFNGATNTLTFKCGSQVQFKTYEQHASTLGGAQLHYVGYDEPPPQRHRDECMTRLLRFGGYEMFAMTPLKTNTGWIRREIYKKREAPYITVVRGSMHDNKTLSDEKRKMVLESYANDLWRQAREFGDFIDVGGLIYPEFERCVVKQPWAPDVVRSWDHVVSIDPGIRNAGIIFEGFDSDNTCHIFDELLLQDSTPKQYAVAIRAVLKRWGIPLERVHFVIDPAARQRGQSNAETVLTALALEGIYCNPGQNDVEAGIGQGRTRMEYGRLFISPACRGLRDEADDYAAVEPDEGKDDSHLVPVKSNDHRLDAARYGWMERFWDPLMEENAPKQQLGWVPGEAPAHFPGRTAEALPMGSMM